MVRPMREARVDLARISRNVETLARETETAHTMAVVKAFGYGHGAVPVARAAVDGGADWLGVVDTAEALQLREAGLTTPVLAWLHDPSIDFTAAVEAGVDLGIGSAPALAAAARAPGRASVHLKVDTGLGRGGATVADAPALMDAAADLERRGEIVVRGLFSHLANAGSEADADQVAGFEAAIEMAQSAGLRPEIAHLASTAGALRVPGARFDMVRLGIGIYGLSPFDGVSSAELGLEPALELSAAIVSVKRVPAGHGVSYGYRYRTTEPTTLVLVPLGYGDGVPRAASGRAAVSIGGRTYPIAGTVAMDQFVVDVGDADVAVDDRAVLFGDPASGVPSVDEWASRLDTINYELVTRLGLRIERTYST